MKRLPILFASILLIICMITGNVFAEGENDSQKATVTFNFLDIGTSQNTVMEVDPGTIITTKPAVPEVSGFMLEGWYSDPEFNNKWFFDTTPVNDNIILYAHWVKTDEDPAPEGTPEDFSDPDEDPAPEGTPEALSYTKGGLTPDGTDEEPALESTPEALSYPEGGLTPDGTGEEPAPESTPEDFSDPDEGPAPEGTPEDSSDPDEGPAPEGTPEDSSDPNEDPAPEGTPEDSSDPDEGPAPEGTPEALSYTKGGLTPNGTVEEPAPESTPEALSHTKGGLTPDGPTPKQDVDTPDTPDTPDEPDTTDPAPETPAGSVQNIDPDKKTEASAPEETEITYPAFHQSQTVQGMVITVSAPEGVFPKDARLLVDLVSNAATESAVEGLREEDANVTASYSFDIRVVDADGHEIQPADEQQICVLFQIEEIGDESLDTTVYHIPDNGPAEVLEVTEDASSETAAVTTDGFSLYRVEFTNTVDKTTHTYKVSGKQLPIIVWLHDILAAVGLKGDVDSIDSSDIKSSTLENNDCYLNIEEKFDEKIVLTVNFKDGSQATINLVMEVMGETFIDGDWEFYPVTGFTEAAIDQYLGNETAITIPDTLHNDTQSFPVTKIAEAVFQNKSSITSIVIPNAVSIIDFAAFDGCSSLTSLILPDSLSRCEAFALSNCTGLTQLIIPGGVQYFDEYAFIGTVNLKDVYFKGDKDRWQYLPGRPYGDNVHVRYWSGTVNVVAAPAEGGTVTGGGWYGYDIKNDIGESVTVEATPAAGYVFVNWTKPDGDPSKPESTDAKYTFTYDGDTVLTAHFAPAFTIKWENDDGTELKSELVAVGTLPDYGKPDPTKAADDDYTYSFKEWSPKVVPVTGDATYKAVYTATKKTIKYIVTEGAGQEYQQGSDGTLTFVFKRSENDEHTFRHFTGLKADGKLLTRDKDYTARSGSLIIELQPAYLKTLAVGNHTLTASFDDGPDADVTFIVDPKPSYTVTFNANGHGTAPNKQTVTQGQKATKPAAPTADGYTFGGWFTDQACTGAFDFSTPITKDLVLYAKWTAIPKYTVTFNANGHGTAPGKQIVTEGKKATKPAAPTADGYTFGGWFTDQACTSAFDFSTPITKDLVLYAKWIPLYTVTFNANGHGTAPGKQIVTEGKKATKPANPTADGYTFGGWFTDQACTSAFDFSTPITKDLVLYAKWIPQYTVKFNANGHGTAPEKQIVTEGQKAKKPTAPTADGYTFGGWFTDQACTSAFDFNTPITKNLVLYAKWTSKSPAPSPGGGSVPRTGDPNTPGLWATLIGLSILLIIAATIVYRKKTR